MEPNDRQKENTGTTGDAVALANKLFEVLDESTTFEHWQFHRERLIGDHSETKSGAEFTGVTSLSDLLPGSRLMGTGEISVGGIIIGASVIFDILQSGEVRVQTVRILKAEGTHQAIAELKDPKVSSAVEEAQKSLSVFAYILSASLRQLKPTHGHSIMELQGLGKEIWRNMDAQEYVRRERSSWNG